MKFGEFIRKRRKYLRLTQKQVEGFDQGLLSKIENGQYPTKREIIADLARALRFQEEQIDWLWVYSLLDRDPYECFGPAQQHAIAGKIAEMPETYNPGPRSLSKIVISKGATITELR